MIEKKIIWQPTPKQASALERTEFEIGYGGSRGGGKTDAGMAWLLYDIAHPQYRALVIRRNANDLSDWIDRARRMYQGTKAEFTSSPSQIKFSSGAVIRLGHLQDENAYEKYLGHEYHRILIEELTLIPSESLYLKLISSCRSTIPELKPQVFSTFNPGGPGNSWVKKRFNLSGTPKQLVITKDETSGHQRVFIPATVDDNPHLLRNDPAYVNFLNSLPDGLREQWRYGSWDNPEIKGAYFSNELRQTEREGRITKVPHDPAFKVETIWDLGIDDYTFIILAQFARETIRILGVIQDEGRGLQSYVKQLKELEIKNHYIYGTHFFPHDIEVREYASGEIPKSRKEIAESLLGANVAVVKKTSIEDRIQALRIIFPRLIFDESGSSPLIDALRNFRRKWDETKQTYGAPIHDWSSHGADAATYLALAYTKVENFGTITATRELIKPSIEEDWGDSLAGVKSPFHY